MKILQRVFKGLDLRQMLVIPFKPQGFEKIKKSLGFVQGLLFIFIFHLLLLVVNSVLDLFRYGADLNEFLFQFYINEFHQFFPFVIYIVLIFLITVWVTAIAAVAKKKTNFSQTFGALCYSAIPAFYLGAISSLSYILAEDFPFLLDRYVIVDIISVLWFLYIGTYAVKAVNKFGTLGSFLTILIAFSMSAALISIIIIVFTFVAYVLLMIMP
jgi:hypothetical protein